MKISTNEIKKIISLCKSKKYDVKMIDIMYAYSLCWFQDQHVVFAAFFGKEASKEQENEYNSSPKITFLYKHLSKNLTKQTKTATAQNKKYADITFEENKDAMIRMIDELEVALNEGKIEYKEYSDRVTKLRIALNDKFAVSEKQDEQRVMVVTKFNTICPHTRKECWLQTKEYAMKHWNLIEKK